MDGSTVGSGSTLGSGTKTTLSAAEKFEDEKRRIIDSCFNKKDTDTTLLESYITHIRIVEDAAYPSSPPPPNSSPDGKKPRLIIVAVRKSGRVRMHKARENANGTFSIGKTWPLDDLTTVESFSGAVPTNIEEEQRKQWAGGVGFIVTIGKPYYWQANSQKEKQFFIASLVKIYTKYTGGKSPELVGFDERERGPLLGINPSQSRPIINKTQQPQFQVPPVPTPSQSQLQNRGPRPSASREPVLRQPSSQEPLPRHQQSGVPNGPPSESRLGPTPRPQINPRRDESPNRSFDSNTAASVQSHSSLVRIATGNPSQESFNSRENINNLRPRSKGGVNGAPATSGRFQDRTATPPAQRTKSPEYSSPAARDVTLNSISSAPTPAPLAIPPERRRPPVQVSSDISQPYGLEEDANLIPAPLVSPGMRKDDIKIPMRSSERPQSPNVEKSATADTEFTQTSRSAGAFPNLAAPQQTPEIPQPLQTDDEEQAMHVTQASSAASSVQLPMATPDVGSPTDQTTDHRPGLGPMIKKKSRADIANTFRKAATAASSFKPRAGGAAERLLQQQEKTTGPDGITGVVPAPSLLRGTSIDSAKVNSAQPLAVEKALATQAGDLTGAVQTKRSTDTLQHSTSDSIPEVKITVPQINGRKDVDSPNEISTSVVIPEKTKPRETRRQKPTSERTRKELASLGLDSSILDGKGLEFVSLLDEFGWVEEGVYTRSIEDMKDDIEREINKAQAGGWLNRLEEEDDRILAISDGIDKCLTECDELDGLLTLYSVELGTLTEDVAYIEAQSQGLQVQAANQKLLQAELQSLLETISISPNQLQSLREAPLAEVQGLAQIENALVMLYKAMVTIDPTLSLAGPRASEDDSVRSGRGGIGDSEIGSMQVLQEKKEIYKSESTHFLHRLKSFLQIQFQMAIRETTEALKQEKSSPVRRTGKVKLDPQNHELARIQLWRYSPLMLFSREVNPFEWEVLMRSYEVYYKQVYEEEFNEGLQAWKRTARKQTGEDNENLFTSQIEKQTEGIATTARKLTVKRSQTLAKKTFNRVELGSRNTVDKNQDGRTHRYEVFGGAVEEMVTLICMEQNFIVEFFHVSSLEIRDFSECVAAAPPDQRRGGDLRRPKPMDPNRDMAKKVVQSMEDLFSFFWANLWALVTWSIEHDSIQGVGVLAVIERKLLELEESNQEFLTRALQKAHNQLKGLFNSFLTEQIRAIEETKVKIKKRKGVIGFIRIFPAFSNTLETMLVSAEDLDIRVTVNEAYGRINKSMFESLKVIAREVPSAVSSGAAMGDPEDKEALNYQILLIENMYYYLEEVDARNNSVLEEWRGKARSELDEHMSLYVGAVIRRPLGKLLDRLESIESVISTGIPPSEVSTKPSHGKSAFQDRLAAFDSKTIAKGIHELKGRVDKHFMKDDHDPTASRSLSNKVLDACEKYYENVEERLRAVSADVYQGDAPIQWARSDVVTSFRR